MSVYPLPYGWDSHSQVSGDGRYIPSLLVQISGPVFERGGVVRAFGVRQEAVVAAPAQIGLSALYGAVFDHAVAAAVRAGGSAEGLFHRERLFSPS
jgi:hypothetical protein